MPEIFLFWKKYLFLLEVNWNQHKTVAHEKPIMPWHIGLCTIKKKRILICFVIMCLTISDKLNKKK